MRKIVILTGAGVSAESGIKTFRDADGLWEGHRIEDVATPAAWYKNPKQVLDFYNERRAQLKRVNPNAAHYALASLDEKYNVKLITQNVDDLHERAGSKNIIHLHGELFKVRSTKYPDLIYKWTEDLTLGQLCEKGNQLRPHIVWFGEEVPMLELAAQECMDGEICIIVGTSLQVYPAAGLIGYFPKYCEIYYIDPKPTISYELQTRKNLKIIAAPASKGVKELVDALLAAI